MAEPTSSATGWWALASTSATLLGLQPDALLPGMVGGLLALSFGQKLSRLRMAASVATSTLLAGYGASVVAAVAVGLVPSLSNAGDSAVRAFVALLLGLLAQQLIGSARSIVAAAGNGVAGGLGERLRRIFGGGNQ